MVTNYGSLPLHAWHEIAGTNMNQLRPQLPPDSNDSDMNNVTANWGSSANDPATGDMHLHGGAHGSNGENNGWYTFNTRRADWRITVPPVYMGPVEKTYLDKAAKLYRADATYSGPWNIGMPPDFMFLPVAGSVRGEPTLADANADSSGRVYAHHGWNKLVWIEWMQRAYVSLIHMYFLDPVNGIQRTWFAFHMDDKTWRSLPWQTFPIVPGAGDYSMVYIPTLGKIIATQGWGELYQIDTATGGVSAFSVQGSARFGSGDNNGMFGRLNYQDGMLFAIDWATKNVKVMRMQ